MHSEVGLISTSFSQQFTTCNNAIGLLASHFLLNTLTNLEKNIGTLNEYKILVKIEYCSAYLQTIYFIDLYGTKDDVYKIFKDKWIL